MSVKRSTKDKIIIAAERLFAEHGFEQTSLRQITAEAEVNLASVNYHFGSKKALIQAVMARYLRHFMPALQHQLTVLDNHSQISSLLIFKAFREPLHGLVVVNPKGPDIFLRLLGFAYAEIQGHLRKYTQAEFGDVLSHLMQLLHKANPNLSPETLFWRLHFTLGATVFAQVSGKALKEIAESDFGEKATTETIIDRLIPYIAGGLDQPATVIAESHS
ncbi:TetR family transcriptional regulator [Idiomarina tyrosinivorans]|uniref:TetR family transcriptional regulator n=1 Tax=Idiomarina tyrosinivorans TaxID=1445662 RepID=A0A432ZRF4_9GAMM|nr:TetR/AcrR family transcriptional regulator [Idiomarina tyrosinivorans]RUO80487.1 TetR family transcriptional regulator [Idiomarina tyrosinivorans]